MSTRGRLGRGHVDVDVPTPGRPLARQSPRIAFVFQGGGSLAACQVGMVRALGESGIVADLVVGSSAGALNAVAFATGGRWELESLDAVWTSLRRKHVAAISPAVVVRLLTGRADGLFSAAGLRAVIEDCLPARLQDTDTPAHVVATDYLSGAPVVLSRGSTAQALLASSAFPGLYPPVRVDGRTFIDGGVSAQVPVLQAEQLGADVTYVLPAARSDRGPRRGPLAMAYRGLGQLLDATARRDAAATTGQVCVLPAPTSDASHPVDFRDTGRLIEDGYRLATRWLATGQDAPVGSGVTARDLASSGS